MCVTWVNVFVLPVSRSSTVNIPIRRKHAHLACIVMKLITSAFQNTRKRKTSRTRNERCPSVGGRGGYIPSEGGSGGEEWKAVEGHGAQRLIIFIDRKKVPDLVWTLPPSLLWRYSNYLRIFCFKS